MCQVSKGERGHKIQVIEEITEKMRNGESVSVRMNTEPGNPFDPNTVVFQTPVNCKWMNIAFVVLEAAPHVSYAITNLSCEFSWVRYIVQSGQGWYTGITITKWGTWPTELVRSSNTI